MPPEVAQHQDLCFGCGRLNLFGLQAELERTGPDEVSGRCFVKQDHQGAEPGFAHDGVIATALVEAMTLVLGPDARLQRFEVAIEGRAPVGAFLEIRAQADRGRAWATARVDGKRVAVARGFG